MMTVVKGSYDPNEITFEDEDGAQFRISDLGEGHFVLRTGPGEGVFSPTHYVDLDSEDMDVLREFLSQDRW